MVRWSDARIPRGVRSILGVPLIIGGILSFLPVLGLWMLPAGIMLIALDIPRYRRRILAWAAKKEDEAAEAARRPEQAAPETASQHIAPHDTPTEKGPAKASRAPSKGAAGAKPPSRAPAAPGR